MRRRCSHCSNKGHNSRTCPTLSSGGVRLFGVRLTDGSISVMKKSASMGNLSSPAAANPTDASFSDDPHHRPPHKKKGVPWTEEEHRLFLAGLQKLGKGDWRGIARDFVVSRTATQVASHAQKYFIRQSSVIRRRRRSSLFDMAPDMATDQPPVPAHTKESDDTNPLNLSLNSEFQPEEKIGEASGFQQLSPGFFQSYVPVPYTIWPPSVAPPTDNDKGTEISHYRVIKPTPIHPQEPVNVNELVGMSRLNIGEAENGAPLSLKLLGEPSRQSAFHASGPSSGSGLGNEKSKSVVQAV